MNRGRCLCLAGLLCFSAVTFAQTSSPITLTVDATHSPEKILHVRETIPVHAGPLTLYYPKWIPGDHGPNGPISSLTGLHFTADGKEIPWKRDLLDVFTFHLDVPAGAAKLDAAYDFIENDGGSATNKLFVLEWNEVTLYPAGTPSKDLTYDATLILPRGWKFGTSLPIEQDRRAIVSSSSRSRSSFSSTRR